MSRIDAISPGLLNASLYFSSLKRQAVFACLSETDWCRPEITAGRLRSVTPADCQSHLDPVVQIARALITSRAREIILAIYGEVPHGLLGALSRIGDQPLPRHCYAVLRKIYADPQFRDKVRALRHVGQISDDVIRAVEIIDHPDVLSPDLTKLLAANGLADDFAKTVRWLKGQSHVDAIALDEAIHRATTRRSLERALSHWIERIEYLSAQPVLNHPSYCLLASVTDLRKAGIEHRVCLGSPEPVRHAALGLVAFAVRRATDEHPLALIELRPYTVGPAAERRWTVASVNVAANASVPTSLKARVYEELGALGFLYPVRPTDDDPAACAIRLLRHLGGGWFAEIEDA